MAAAIFDLVGIEKIVSVDYLETVLRCYREGRVAVPIDPGADAPPGLTLAERIVPKVGGGWFSLAQAPIDDDRPAHIAFSSGTTGAPKAILLSHRALGDVTNRLIEAMGIDGEISEYLGVPPTYSFGLARARVTAAVGGRLFVPGHGFDPIELATMLEAGEVNALSAVPTLLRVLIANPELIPKKAARKLRWLEIGSQPMTSEDKHAVRRLFPGARIIQHYGLTEASRTTFLDLQEASDAELASVGKPIGATEVRIDGESRICIRGPHVADGILTAQGVTPIVDGDGWLRTNDLGRIDEAGTLFFDGRSDYLLNVGGVKVPAELFEQKLAARIGADAAAMAVAGRPDPLRGEVVMVAHEATLAAAPLAVEARAVGAEFGLGPADVVVVQVGAIPRTDTGKVKRAALTELGVLPAEDPGLGAAAPSETGTPLVGDDDMTDREREIATIWRGALGLATVHRNSSFFDIGGDSLSAISVMLHMERAGIAKAITQQIFEGRTIAEIAANIDGTAERQAPARRAETSDTITITRGLLVLLVVAAHWSPALFVRMGQLGQNLLIATSPIFRGGTPGFAMVFGIGLGFFNMPMVTRNPDRLKANIRTNMLILAAGVLALGAINLLPILLTHSWGPQSIDLLFYNVLSAYLLLAAISGVVLRFIARFRHPILVSILAAVVSLLVSEAVRMSILSEQVSGVTDLARLLIVAKYGIPEMLGYVLAGLAMGLWIEQELENDALPTLAMLSGTSLILVSVLLTTALGLGPLWYRNSATTQMVIAYAGGVLFLFGAFLAMVRRGWARGTLKLPFRLLLLVGILAFAVYVGHEAVLRLKDIGDILLIRDAISLPVLLAVFFGGAAWLMRKLYRLYYG